MVSIAIYSLVITVGLIVLFSAFGVAIGYRMKIPAQFQWQELAEGAISAAGKVALDDVEREVSQLNFAPVKTYTYRGYRYRNENRLFYCPDSGSTLVASFFESMASKGTVFELITRFEDGQSLQTIGRIGMKSSLMPGMESISSLSGVANAAELYKRHLQRVESKKAAGVGIRYLQSDKIMEEFAQDYARRAEESVKKGLWKFDPQANCYRVAPLGFLKNIQGLFGAQSSTELWGPRRRLMLILFPIIFYIMVFLFLLVDKVIKP